jgi:hypothetical protein
VTSRLASKYHSIRVIIAEQYHADAVWQQRILTILSGTFKFFYKWSIANYAENNFFT